MAGPKRTADSERDTENEDNTHLGVLPARPAFVLELHGPSERFRDADRSTRQTRVAAGRGSLAYIAPGRDLVDELIDERHAEVSGHPLAAPGEHRP